MRRLIFPLILGLGGLAILLSLGIWQFQRLEWKQGVIAEIDARIGADPVSLPDIIDPQADKYRPVDLSGQGRFTGNRLFVLRSIEDVGPGFRVIESYVLNDNRTIMVERGFVRDGEQSDITTISPSTLIGNMHWPQEVDSWTPAPEGTLWFARDVPAMSQALGADPVLVVARETDPADPVVRLTPIDTAGIKNDHLNYAITWFLLALVWALMSGAFAWRMWAGPKKDAT